MHISVVVPFHGAERYIEACVTALVNQDYPRNRFEMIFVDNNSTDRSAEIVRRHPAATLLSEPKPGAYAARNRGVAAAAGAIIGFTDADCVPAPGWLRAIAEAMSDPRVDLILGRRLNAVEGGAMALLADYEAAKAAYVFSSRRRELYYGYTNNMAVRRTVFDRSGPFLEWMRGADTVFVDRVVNASSVDGVRYVPGMIVRHLEIGSVVSWLAKRYIYGRSWRLSAAEADRRPLGADDRRRIFQDVTRAHSYSVAQSTALRALLGAGHAAWQLGRRRPTPPLAGII
jgi:glycosyltransferase involved in cell wall biosynthesis